MAFEPGRLVAQEPMELEQQARLADARLAHDEHDLAVAGLRLFEALEEHAQLALAADIGREPALGHDVQPRARRARGDHLPRRHRLRLALEHERAERAREEVPLDEPVRCLRYDDATRIGRLLQPRRYVGGVAHGRVIHSQI